MAKAIITSNTTMLAAVMDSLKCVSSHQPVVDEYPQHCCGLSRVANGDHGCRCSASGCLSC